MGGRAGYYVRTLHQCIARDARCLLASCGFSRKYSIAYPKHRLSLFLIFTTACFLSMNFGNGFHASPCSGLYAAIFKYNLLIPARTNPDFSLINLAFSSLILSVRIPSENLYGFPHPFTIPNRLNILVGGALRYASNPLFHHLDSLILN